MITMIAGSTLRQSLISFRSGSLWLKSSGLAKLDLRLWFSSLLNHCRILFSKKWMIRSKNVSLTWQQLRTSRMILTQKSRQRRNKSSKSWTDRLSLYRHYIREHLISTTKLDSIFSWLTGKIRTRRFSIGPPFPSYVIVPSCCITQCRTTSQRKTSWAGRNWRGKKMNKKWWMTMSSSLISSMSLSKSWCFSKIPVSQRTIQYFQERNLSALNQISNKLRSTKRKFNLC